jgi:hypothetical protein
MDFNFHLVEEHGRANENNEEDEEEEVEARRTHIHE